MQGVEILNQTEIMKREGSFWWLGLIMFGIVLAICLFNKDFGGKFTERLLAGTVVGVVFGLSIWFLGSRILAKHTPTGVYEYQVTISDEVELNAFLEKYDIIKQEGKIYTVVLKDTDKS